MTLSDVHDRPEVLAKLLGVPFEPAAVIDRNTVARYPVPRQVTAEERVRRAYAEYRAANELAWSKSAQNPYREQTWGQFLAECLREGLGIRKAGKLADRLTYATMARPDLYRAA